MLQEVKTILDAAGQFYDITPSAKAVLNEIVVGEAKRRQGTFTKVHYGKLHFQNKTKYSAEAVEDAWKLLVKMKMIRITPRPGQTHVFEINPIVYDFCVQIRFLNFHIKPKKYLKEVMEGLTGNPLFLVQKYRSLHSNKLQKVPPPILQKVPPIRTSSLVGLNSRVRIPVRAPNLDFGKTPKRQKQNPIVEGLPFFTDYEKYRISTDYEHEDILEAKRDMDNYRYKFMKTINSEAGYFIDAVNRQKNRRLGYGKTKI